MNIRDEIQMKVKERVDKHQREYILREQLKLIREELGEDTTISDAEEFAQKAEALDAPDEVKEKLKKDGIIGFIEKFSNKDITEFLKREHIKDSLFKNRFFSQKDIQLKKDNVLTDMNNGLVTLTHLKTF
mgnify:FL=1